ncbi:MAG: hypothetical protein ACRC1T_05600 [Clostridium chrysemydis]|uniref:WDGH domain-containing protein n=1 Tax=Clostridium chrysemydis TaxID=2665504 RepID=UPI003F3FE715
MGLKEIQYIIDNAKAQGLDIRQLNDGCHSYEELYYHRMILFSIICNANPTNAWKSYKHDDGSEWEGFFKVAIDTPMGQYSYHYKNEFWDMFKVQELEMAKPYDGHTPKDIDRLLSL